jgi:hypothetical protein
MGHEFTVTDCYRRLNRNWEIRLRNACVKKGWLVEADKNQLVGVALTSSIKPCVVKNVSRGVGQRGPVINFRYVPEADFNAPKPFTSSVSCAKAIASA